MAGEQPAGIPVNPMFMGGSAMGMPYNMYNPSIQYGVLPYQTPEFNATGGMPNKAAGLMQGLSAGANFAGNLRANQRANQNYQQQQLTQHLNDYRTIQQELGNKDLSDSDRQMLQHYHDQIAGQISGGLASGGQTPPSPLQSFLSTVGQGAQKVGQAVGGVLPSWMEQGGVVPDFMSYPHEVVGMGSVVPASTQGQQPPNAPAGGQFRGFATGGDPGDPNAGTPVPPTGMPPTDPDGGQPQPQAAPGQSAPLMSMDAQTQTPVEAIQAFEDFATHLHKAALNDAGVPNGKQGIPQGGDPKAAAASNPAVAAGKPEDGPQPSQHSLTSQWYAHLDALAALAAGHAAEAGHDPSQVYGALQNMTTSFLQTHIMREASSAAVAFQNGDMDSVEKSLHNMNYYIPNGQGLNIKKDGNGQLTYQNPIYPWIGKDGQPSDQFSADAKPNMQPVDLQHLSYLAQAAANPMEIGQLIQGARIQSEQAQAKLRTSWGEYYRGLGIYGSGQGAEARGKAALGRMPYQNILDYNESQKALMQAQTTKFALKGLEGLPPATQTNMKAGSDAWDQLFRGTPAVDTNTLSPNEGKATSDTSRALKLPDGEAGMQQYMQGKALTVQLAAGGLPGAQAAQVAEQVRESQIGTHPAKGDTSALAQGAKNGQVKNVAIDKQGLHLWTGKGWQTYPLADPQAVLAAGRDRQSLMAILVGVAAAGGKPPPGAVLPGGGDETASLDREGAGMGGGENGSSGSSD